MFCYTVSLKLKEMFLKLLVILLSLNTLVYSVTQQQIKSVGKIFKKACMPKNGVTEEQVGDIDKGKFIEDRNVMCYIACVYRMNRVIKKEKIIYSAMIKQADTMLPVEMKGPVKASIENCKGIAKKYSDICEASFWTAKCMYDYDPRYFFFA